MTSALDAKELSENVVEAVAAMKTDKVGDVSLYKMMIELVFSRLT